MQGCDRQSHLPDLAERLRTCTVLRTNSVQSRLVRVRGWGQADKSASKCLRARPGAIVHWRHHCRQTSLKSDMRWRANRAPSQSGERAIRSRSPARRDGQVGEVLGEPDGPVDVIAAIGRHGLGQPDVRQVGERVPAGEGLARAGHDRNAHPEGLAGRHAPRVGERDRGPGRSCCRRRAARARSRLPRSSSCSRSPPAATNASPIRSRAVAPPRAGDTSNSRDPGTRRTISAQSAMHLGRELGDVVEAAERDVAPLERRQGPDRGRFGRRVEADVAVGHPEDLSRGNAPRRRGGRGTGRRSGSPSPPGRSSRRSRSR